MGRMDGGIVAGDSFKDLETIIGDAENAYDLNLNGDGKDLPGSLVVRDAIAIRDEGLSALRGGHPRAGSEIIEESIRLLGTHHVDGFWAHVEGFDREVYASLAAKAQALCAAGEFDEALGFAALARPFTPEPLLFGQRDGEDVPDQYEVSFGGRLALVMSTASWGSYSRGISTLMFKRARAIAPLSQDPNRVVFVDRSLNDEDRRNSAHNAKLLANVGTAFCRVPVRTVRSRVAEVLCSF